MKNDDENLLTPQQASNYLHVSVCTLAKYRRDGVGPTYIKLGYRCVRYRLDDLKNYVEQKEENRKWKSVNKTLDNWR